MASRPARCPAGWSAAPSTHRPEGRAQRQDRVEIVMAASFDLVIRGGMIVDGTGAPGYVGDVAVKDGRIAAVGKVEGAGKEEINAAGRLLTTGLVDIHTHYDGHVT